MDYRATPHSTTGVSPSELLHGRRMRTKLVIKEMPVPITEKHTVRERVKQKQAKLKQYTDAHRHAKTTAFRPGDQVRVRKPWKVKKGELKFTTPMTVVARKGSNSYLLDDGKVWNASSLSALPELNQELDIDNVMDCTENETYKPPEPESCAQLRLTRSKNMTLSCLNGSKGMP